MVGVCAGVVDRMGQVSRVVSLVRFSLSLVLAFDSFTLHCSPSKTFNTALH